MEEMHGQYPKCELCGQLGVAKRHMQVNAEFDSTDEGDGLIGVYADMWLCAEHIEAYDNNET